jgi:omega-amidase
MTKEKLHITCIQTKLHWENVNENLAMFQDIIDKIETNTDLIILPEMFSTGFTNNTNIIDFEENNKTIDFLKTISKNKNCAVGGSIIFKNKEEKYYNRFVWVNGEEILFYDKKHLFSLAKENNFFEKGESKLIIEFKGWKICPMICYDLRFPVWSKRTKKEDFDLLIYVANWPQKRSSAWKNLLIARAIENQTYTIGVNRVGTDGNGIYYSGDSAIIDFMGDLQKSASDVEAVLQIEIEKSPQTAFREAFPIINDDDLFEIIS